MQNCGIPINRDEIFIVLTTYEELGVKKEILQNSVFSYPRASCPTLKVQHSVSQSLAEPHLISLAYSFDINSLLRITGKSRYIGVANHLSGTSQHIGSPCRLWRHSNKWRRFIHGSGTIPKGRPVVKQEHAAWINLDIIVIAIQKRIGRSVLIKSR